MSTCPFCSTNILPSVFACPNCGVCIAKEIPTQNAPPSTSARPLGTTKKVIIKRDSQMTGCACKVRVFLDGTNVGELMGGEELVINADNGKHTISVSGGMLKGKLEINTCDPMPEIRLKTGFSNWGAIFGKGLYLEKTL